MDLQKRGSRLLVACIDHVARQQPDRIWTLRPRNDACLSDGFEKITFARLANAINHAAWWLQKTLGEPQAPFETFAFQAPNDLRIPILAAATVKAGRVVNGASSLSPEYSNTEWLHRCSYHRQH